MIQCDWKERWLSLLNTNPPYDRIRLDARFLATHESTSSPWKAWHPCNIMIFTKQKNYNSHQVQLIYVTSFCLISSTLAVSFRLLARRKFGIKLWWDDYIAILALVGNIPSFDWTESSRLIRYFHIFQMFLHFLV